MVFGLVSNVLNVLFLCAVVIWLEHSLHKKYSHYLLGVLFGLITIFVINGRITIVHDRYFDFRNITLSMAGFIGGPITAGIAAFIASLFRYFIGGNGSMGGITSIILSACFGCILGRYVKSHQNKKKLSFWFVIGIIISCISLFSIAFIPQWKGDSATVLRDAAFPVLIINSLATTIIYYFYFRTYDFLGKATILNTIMKNSPLSLMINDSHEPIMFSKNLKNLRQSSQKLEKLLQLTDTDLTYLNKTKQLRREITTEDDSHLVADFSSFQMPSGEDACIAIVNDITERRKEKEMLRRATDRFKKVFQLSPLMMAIIRKSDYQYIDVNDRFLEERKYIREDVIGKTPVEMGVFEREFKQIVESMELQGSLKNVEWKLMTKFGLKGTSILSANPIQIDDQECILLAYNDITEMKQMQAERVEQLTKFLALEAQLSYSNQLIADIITNMPDPFYVLDHEWRFMFVNKKAEEMFSKTREELIGNVIWEINPQSQGCLCDLNFQKAKINCLPVTFEIRCVLNNDRWNQVTAYPSKFGLSVYYRDITEQKLAHEKLTKSERKMTSILENMTDCFFEIDINFQFTYINRAGELVFGKSRDELLGKNITTHNINDTTLSYYHEVMNEKKSVSFEILSEFLGGKWVEISVYPTETGLAGYFRDITSRKKAQEEIARLDRLNLVGQLAAGIGHEIRNPMTTVRGYLQLLGVKPNYAAQKSTFDLMISELDRANEIITEFLSLAQTRQTELKPQNLNDILNHVYPLIEADTFTQNKQILFIPGEIPNLELNAKEITQLILNVARNGLEAMEERGCLTIKSYLKDDKVVLAITDEGCGILPENAKKLGTPFFTTKDYGTGLGLATCYKIAESHYAKISVDSNQSGTTFYILFPIPDQEQQDKDMLTRRKKEIERACN